MPNLDPQFNGWAFSNVNLTISRANFGWSFPARPEKVIAGDWGHSPEVGGAGRMIRLAGSWVASSNTDARDQFATFMKQIRGDDRTKRGMLDLYGDGHYWAQILGNPQIDLLQGEGGHASVSIEFFADDPYRRDNKITILAHDLSSSTSQTVSWSGGGDFDGDAARIPLIMNIGGSHTKGDLFRFQNITTGEYFELEIPVTPAASEDIVIDGELGEIYVGDRLYTRGVSGTFPYLRGGGANSFSYAGTTNTPVVLVEFWDRYVA